MKLVLADIATWHLQLKAELNQIDEQIDKLKGQLEDLKKTRTLAVTKISESKDLLDKLDFEIPEPAVTEEEEAAAEALEVEVEEKAKASAK